MNKIIYIHKYVCKYVCKYKKKKYIHKYIKYYRLFTFKETKGTEDRHFYRETFTTIGFKKSRKSTRRYRWSTTKQQQQQNNSNKKLNEINKIYVRIQNAINYRNDI